MTLSNQVIALVLNFIASIVPFYEQLMELT
jgi:hypothetical protein